MLPAGSFKFKVAWIEPQRGNATAKQTAEHEYRRSPGDRSKRDGTSISQEADKSTQFTMLFSKPQGFAPSVLVTAIDWHPSTSASNLASMKTLNVSPLSCARMFRMPSTSRSLKSR